MSFTRHQHSRDKNDTNLMLFFLGDRFIHWAIAFFQGCNHKKNPVSCLDTGVTGKL
ncbi:hypothetical protein [Fortiea contorta]|uniref:hypothetical protein n=1 Tax=Fortiea contorta TaxID=1892405 RepID=UPI00034DBDD1|nr:hypothetical protein [Fortiea contorta]